MKGLGIDTDYGPIDRVANPFLFNPSMLEVLNARKQDLVIGDNPQGLPGTNIDEAIVFQCVQGASSMSKPEETCANLILMCAHHFIAAIQNAANNSVSYERTVDQVIMDWDNSFSGNIKDNLDNFMMFYEPLHELDCPL